MKTSSIIALAMAAASAAKAQPVESAPAATYREKTQVVKAAALGPRPSYASLIQPPKLVALAPLTSAELARPAADGGRVVGVHRDMDETRTASGTWETLPDGRRIWRVAIHSPRAVALRVHFSDFNVGRGRVWLYAMGQGDPSPEARGPYTGKGLFNDGAFWSGIVFGDKVTIEFEPEISTDVGQDVPFRIHEIAHLYASPISDENVRRVEGEGLQGAGDIDFGLPAGCHVDASCAPQWQEKSRAVAAMVVARGRSVLTCSGTLLNTQGGPVAPYFLTANHCLQNDAEARSLVTFWNYQTSECRGRPPVKSSVPQVEGARLLATGGIGEGDFSLVVLAERPPQGAVYSGWTTAEVPLGGRLVGIHHPSGSFKRISAGARGPNASVRISDTGETAPADRYYQVNWTEGLTEGGSSGSGLFNESDQLVGALSYGPPPQCGGPNRSGYGRFSVYFPALRQFLTGQSAPDPVSTNAPEFNARSIVNAFSSQPAVAPGSLVTIYGRNLATAWPRLIGCRCLPR